MRWRTRSHPRGLVRPPRTAASAVRLALVTALVLVVAGTERSCAAGKGPYTSSPRAAPGARSQEGTPAHVRRFSSTRDIAVIVNRLKPGDVAVLATGTYGQRGRTFSWDASGSASRPIVIKAAPHASVTLLGNNVITGSYVIVENLVFSGPTGPISDRARQPHQEYVLGIRGNFVTIRDSEVRNGVWHAGIYILGNYARISHCWVHDNGAWSDPRESNVDHGIYFGGGEGGVITGNVINHNLSYGVQIYPSAVDVAVTGNVILGNGTMHSSGHGGGILLGGRARDVTIADNVIAFNDGSDIRTGSSYHGTGNVATGNISYGNATAAWSGAGGISLHGNNSSDPCDLILERVAPSVVPPACRPR